MADADDRVAALLARLDLGDWSALDDLSDDLVPVYQDGLRAVGITGNVPTTRNQARANLGLPPLSEAKGGNEEIDVFGRMADSAEQWVADHVAELVAGLKARTPGMLEATVDAALAGDFTAEQLARAIADSPAFSTKRAETIANNETTQAEREGLGTAGRTTQVALGRQWTTMEDDAVEEDCIENADAGVISWDEDWPNGDYPHIGCRCWWELADIDDDE
jgi:hypothetical protein